jgi:hypothetical protein
MELTRLPGGADSYSHNMQSNLYRLVRSIRGSLTLLQCLMILPISGCGDMGSSLGRVYTPIIPLFVLNGLIGNRRGSTRIWGCPPNPENITVNPDDPLNTFALRCAKICSGVALNNPGVIYLAMQIWAGLADKQESYG